MEEFDTTLYLWLNEWSKDLERLARDFPDDVPGRDDDGITLGHLKHLQRQCERLGFKTTSHHLSVMVACIEAGRGFGEIGSLGSDVHKSLFIELQSTVFLALLPGRASFYSEPYQDWEAVIDRFPETSGDVEEARKCFALNRYAASVFHCMQIIEAALIELGRFLKMPKAARPSWNNTTETIRQILEKERDPKKRATLSTFERNNLEKLRQIQGVAAPLQAAWRNKVSHAGEHLVLLSPDFKSEIAGEIMTASLAFTRRLAAELPPRRKGSRG